MSDNARQQDSRSDPEVVLAVCLIFDLVHLLFGLDLRDRDRVRVAFQRHEYLTDVASTTYQCLFLVQNTVWPILNLLCIVVF